MRFFIAILFLVGFVSAIDVDLDCPDEIFAGEEFECDVEVDGGDEVYDLKVEVDEERDSVLKIWNENEGWKSGYYYLTEFVEDDEVVKLKILESGKYDVVLKLRCGDFREEFDVGKLKVLESEADDVEAEDGVKGNDSEAEVGSKEDNVGAEIIDLSGNFVGADSLENADSSDEWDYVSKDGQIVDWLPYGLCLFLIFLVVVILWSQVAQN